MGKWILFASFCMRKLIFAGTMKANGVILEDVVKHLNTTNSLVAWAFAIQNGIGYLSSPLAALLLKVVSNTQLALLGGLMCSAGYIYCGLQMDAVWKLFFSFTLSGIGFGFATLPVYLVLREHFEVKDICAAISFSALFDYVGVAMLPPVLQFFRSQYGLQNSLILLGALVLNMVVCGVACKTSSNVANGNNASSSQNIEMTSASSSEAKEEGYEKIPLETKSKNDPRSKWSTFVPTLFRHNNIAILMIMEFVGFYLFISWALFLVSLGRSLGLSDEESVLLSTAGGIGGFFGRICTVVLVQAKKLNAWTAGFIPFIITGSMFVSVSFFRNFYAIASLIFISGFSQGQNTSSIFGQIPAFVCNNHYKQTVMMELIFGGIAMQFSGFISGLIQDFTGSTVNVYLFNAGLAFGMVPLAIWWSFDGKPNLDCGIS